MSTEEASALADKTLAVLDEYGWHQGTYGSKAEGYCLLGALGAALDWQQHSQAEVTLRGAIYRVFQREDGRVWSIAGWNDAKGRSVEDVKLLLKEAKGLLDE